MAQGTGRARLTTRALVTVAGALSVLVVAVPGAAAQGGGDPYGGTTTTTGAATDVSCSVTLSQARVGSAVGGQVSGVEPGTSLRLFLADAAVGDVTASADRADFGFTVPDVAPGRYRLAAVGPTATVECAVPGGGIEIEVLSAGAVRLGGADGTAVRSGSLAVTGAHVLVAALLGVALVALGLVLRSRALLRRASAGH